MKGETVDYYRIREGAERLAAVRASCDQARWAHEQMAEAYARLIELEELKAIGALPPAKVVAIADVLGAREQSEYGRRSAGQRAARKSAPTARRT